MKFATNERGNVPCLMRAGADLVKTEKSEDYINSLMEIGEVTEKGNVVIVKTKNEEYIIDAPICNKKKKASNVVEQTDADKQS